MGWLAVQIEAPAAHHPELGRSGLIGLAVFAVGLALVVRGALPLLRAHRWNARSILLDARVIDNRPGADRRGRPGRQPVVEFALGEDTLRAPLSGVAALHGWPLGLDVAVRVDPAAPAEPRVAGTSRRRSWTLVAGLAVVVIYLALSST